MEIVSGMLCEVCREHEAVVRCDGCGQALCRKCRLFDIWCYGCGHGDTKAFCKQCNENPTINIWKTPV